jgi:hypothetical protein
VSTFTQAEIEALIACPKAVVEAPTREMKMDRGHRRKDAKLVPTDGTKGYFWLFIRESAEFQENFSVGLIYHPHDGRSDITLIRCNGKHGEFNRGNNAFDPAHPHWHFHVHRATQEALDSGCVAEKNAAVTTEFASLIEAVQYLVKTINIGSQDAARYFAANRQSEFEFGGD